MVAHSERGSRARTGASAASTGSSATPQQQTRAAAPATRKAAATGKAATARKSTAATPKTAATTKAPATSRTPARKAPARNGTTRKGAGRGAAEPAVHQPADPDDLLAGPPDDGSVADTTHATPHRPSRRHLIVDAAIRVFARRGFSEASIQEIADDAGMVATAVYYHFAGKEELFEAALMRCIEGQDQVIGEARPDDAPGSAEIFAKVIDASWKWAAANPDMARLLFLHSPGAATPRTRTMAQEFIERHAQRAYDYFEAKPVPANRRRAAAEYAVRTLIVRTVMGVTLSVHQLPMEGGLLSGVSPARTRKATADVSARLFRS